MSNILIRRQDGARAQATRTSTIARQWSGDNRAFTLIELLITIGIIGVLIGILSPAIRGALAAAGRTGSLSNLRQLGITVEAFTQSNKGRYLVTAPGHSYPVSLNGDMGFGPGNRWQSLYAWPGALAEFAPLRAYFEILFSPGSPKLRKFKLNAFGPYTSYWYANSFVAQPALWTPGVTPTASMLVVTRVDQVEFTANKVLFWDVERAYDKRWLREHANVDDAPTPMLFADAHADVKKPADAADAQPNPLNSRAGDASMRLSNTLRGVRGRDY